MFLSCLVIITRRYHRETWIFFGKSYWYFLGMENKWNVLYLMLLFVLERRNGLEMHMKLHFLCSVLLYKCMTKLFQIITKMKTTMTKYYIFLPYLKSCHRTYCIYSFKFNLITTSQFVRSSGTGAERWIYRSSCLIDNHSASHYFFYIQKIKFN